MSTRRSMLLFWELVVLWSSATVGSCTGNNSGFDPAGGKCKPDCLACDPALGCLECASDNQCPAGSPRCVRGKCEVCASNADCPAATPVCFPDDDRCHGACPATSCSGETPYCNTSTGACVGCNSNADCTDPEKRLCDSVTFQCVTCTSNADCGAGAPFCYVRKGKCVSCLTNADCPQAAPICDDELECGTGCPSGTCESDASTR